MTEMYREKLAAFIRSHAIAATLIEPSQETPTVALAAQALDFKAIEAKWQKSRELKDDEMSVKISVTWYAGEYIQALFQQQAEKNLWT